jgi:hypothetical protein
VAKKIKKKRAPVKLPRPKSPLERLERRVEILEAIVGLDDEAFPLPESVTVTTPLGVVISELGVTEEEMPLLIKFMKVQVARWRQEGE